MQRGWEKLITDIEFKNLIINNAYELAVKEYDINKVADNFIEVYKDLKKDT